MRPFVASHRWGLCRCRPRLAALTLALAFGCSDGGEPTPGASPKCASFDELRQPFFGDTHVHTALSFDASARDTRLGPEGAYRYARGEEVDIPPYDLDGTPFRTLQRPRPLDFVMISDHAEFLGSVAQCTDESSEGYDHPQCEDYRARASVSFFTFGVLLSEAPNAAHYPALCDDDFEACVRDGIDVWRASVDAANAANDNSSACSFTALIGYEWTGNPGTNNLHRNVMFRGDVVPDRAIGYFDEPHVEGLWEHLREDCLSNGSGCDVLTIPHNSNLASGLFFEPLDREGAPIGEAYSRERAFMEPVIEIYQHKGESECLPGQLASDELCGFEKLPYANLGEVNLGVETSPSPRDFVRDALGEGMKLERSLGANPFKHGFVASTDTHIATPGATSERLYPGHVTTAPIGSPPLPGLLDDPYQGPGGLAAVWAEENSRASIFDAMRRRETYGTSGPHMVVRFFGGWDYPSDMCADAEFARIGYDDGVPMGGDLPTPPSTAARPTFAVLAMQDPGTDEDPGTPLQRLQVIKGWVDDSGESRVRVFDVAGDPQNGATVDLGTCELDSGAGGFADLCTLWTDPDFDPTLPAYYYARVLEDPVCRWTQYACNRGGVDCSEPSTITEGFEGCCDPDVPATVQERAWTSPIWYSPR